MNGFFITNPYANLANDLYVAFMHFQSNALAFIVKMYKMWRTLFKAGFAMILYIFYLTIFSVRVVFIAGTDRIY